VSTLFDQLVATTGARVDRHHEAHLDCPWCGKEAKAHQRHFAFNARGCHCFVCGAGGSLQRLAEQLGAPVDAARRYTQERPERPQKARSWQIRPEVYLDAFCGAWDRVERWTSYKPLSLDTIARWRLGVGTLPSSPCQHRRLIYPIVEARQIVGFRGRALGCECDKWISSGGTTARLWGIDLLRAGATIIVAENPVDAMLAMQFEPGVVAVAGTAGAATWHDEWSAAIAASRPERALIWFDNDLAGAANKPTYQLLLKEWQRTMEERLRQGKLKQLPRPPRPNAAKVANSLLEAGVITTCYTWPEGTPAKYDLGQLLEDSLAARSAA
jgi:hypothetical protein